MGASANYCPHCGAELSGAGSQCTVCGADPGAGSGKRKSPGLAALLSLLLVGLGQLYVGKVGRALAVFAGGLLFAAVLTAAAPSVAPIAYLVPVVAAFDAWFQAAAVNRSRGGSVGRSNRRGADPAGSSREGGDSRQQHADDSPRARR